MQEHQQREEPVSQHARQEVARGRRAEDRQPVEPFGAGDGGEQAELVPYQPIAADAGGVDQPDRRHAGDPGIPAEAVKAPVEEFAQEMQQHHQHQAVGGIAVQAAQEARAAHKAVENKVKINREYD